MNSMAYRSVTRGITLAWLVVVLAATVHAGDITIDGSLIVSNTLTVQGSASFETNLSVNGAISAQSLMLSGASRSSWYDKAGSIYETNFSSDPFYPGSTWSNDLRVWWDSEFGGRVVGGYNSGYACEARLSVGFQPYGVYEAVFSVSNTTDANLQVFKGGTQVVSITHGSGSQAIRWTAEWDELRLYHGIAVVGGPMYWYDFRVSCVTPISTTSVGSAESVQARRGLFDELDVAVARLQTAATTNLTGLTESNSLVVQTIDRTDANAVKRDGGGSVQILSHFGPE